MHKHDRNRTGPSGGFQSRLALLAGIALITIQADLSTAANYTFDANASTTGAQDGDGTTSGKLWNTSNAIWWDGTATVAWPNTNTSVAVLGAASTNNTGYSVTVSGTVDANGITFSQVDTGNTNGRYQILGGSSGTINLVGTSPTITVNNTIASNNSQIRATLTGTSGFTKAGAGTLILGSTSGNDADLTGLSGTISLNAGNTFLNTANSSSAAATWNIATSGVNLGLSASTTFNLGALSGVSGAVLRAGGSFTPTASIGALNADTTYAGRIGNGIVAGDNIAITKVGNGTLILNGTASTYTGGTTISGGTLLANNASGSATGAGAVAVSSGGSLGGGGFINTSSTNAGVSVAAGGKLAPGASAGTVGTLTMNLGSGSLDVGSDNTKAVFAANSASLKFDLTTTGNDRVVLSNALSVLNIGTGKLELDDFAFTFGPGFGAGTYTLFDTSNTITGTLGANVTGTLTGNLTGTLSLANSNQDIILTVTVPDPASVSIGLLTMVGLLHRRRRQV